jgi:hypothetical protein
LIALEFDWWHELAKADGALEDDEQSQPLGADGCLYYVRFRHAGEETTPTWPDSAGFDTIEGAMHAAEGKTPTAIAWGPISGG